MNYYYLFNREERFKKAYDKYHNKGGKEKAAFYYQKNKEMIKKREKDRYRSMTDIERNEKKRKSLERYYKRKAQYFYEGKKAVNLGEVSVDKIAVSNKIKGNNETSKVFIGYMDDISDIVTPLCIILPQMSGWIKYFENGGKNMSFKIEDDSVFI